jgi:glutathione peroxidase
MNGWNIQAPSWNFSKYLIDERGLLIGYFDPSVTPDNPELQDLLDRTSTVR